jgi:hypothetical protein
MNQFANKIGAFCMEAAERAMQGRAHNRFRRDQSDWQVREPGHAGAQAISVE